MIRGVLSDLFQFSQQKTKQNNHCYEKNLRNAFYTACIACASVGTSIATSTTTNDIITLPIEADTVTDFKVLATTTVPTTWPRIWQDEFEKRNEIVMSDAFGPQSSVMWTRRAEHGYEFNANYANTGRNAIQHAFLDSVRESIVRVPGIFDSKS